MMTRIVTHIAAAVFMAAVSATGVLAGEAQVGDITVEGPWARASAGMAKAGAAFMTLKNTGSADDRLVAASSDIAKTTELHTHIREGDVMRMRAVDAIDVPAGGVTEMQPGGLHVMFMGLLEPLQEGESFPLTLSFEKAGEVTVDVMVMGAGAMGQGPMQGQGHGHGGGQGQMKMKTQ